MSSQPPVRLRSAPLAALARRVAWGALGAMLVALGPTGTALAEDAEWQVLAPTSLESSAGSTLTLQADGSILVTGPEPEKDVYEIEAALPAGPVLALRIEAIQHASLPRGGTGRSGNANVCVSEVELDVIKGRKKRATRVRFDAAHATRENKNSARCAIDGDPASHWGFNGAGGDPIALVLPLEEPLAAGTAGRLRVTIRQTSQWKNHGLGAFRISTTSSPDAVKRYVPDLGPLAARVDDATWRGIQFLLSRQHPDGTWFSGREPDRHLGMTALCAYALAKSGVPEEHESLVRALTFLETHPATEVYDASLRVLWHTSADPEGRRNLILRAAEVLDYSPGMYYDYVVSAKAGDLSNHQFAVVALHALDASGFDVKRKTWERIAANIEATQRNSGGWGYRADGDPTPTMSVAGLAVAAACRNALTRARAKPRLVRRAEDVTEAGLAYLGAHWYVDQPRSKGPLDRWFYYGCYGMERAAALSGVTHFGDHDWYAEVAGIICDEQRDDGSWHNPWGEPERNTAFCLLTLSRATASTGVPSIPGRFEHRWTSAGGDSELGITVIGAPGARAYLAGLGTAVAARHTWEGDHRPRITQLQWFLGDDPVGDPIRTGGDSATESPVGALPRFEGQLDLPTNGDHIIRAVAWVVPPGKTEAEAVEVRSAPLALPVRGLVDATARAGIDHVVRAANVASPRSDAIVSSSAVNEGEFAAKNAFDRSEATRWLAKKDDDEPTIRTTWKRPIIVGEIRLLPALQAGHLSDGTGYDAPRRVTIILNGKIEHVVEMTAADRLAGASLVLDEPLGLRSLTVRIEARDPGERDAGRAGWREIQLLGPR